MNKDTNLSVKQDHLEELVLYQLPGRWNQKEKASIGQSFQGPAVHKDLAVCFPVPFCLSFAALLF